MIVDCRACNNRFSPECPVCGAVEELDVPEPPSIFCHNCMNPIKIGEQVVMVDSTLDAIRQQQRIIFDKSVGITTPLEELGPIGIEIVRVCLEEMLFKAASELKRLNAFASPVVGDMPVRRQ
jgi:hypothetical protein